jgi:hypothetical protein
MFLLPHFTRAFVVRSVAAWGFVRICLAGSSMIAAGLARRPPPPDPFSVTPGVAVLVVLTAAAVSLLFARLRNEDLLLATLGYWPGPMISLAALVPALLEVASALLARA